MWYVGLNVHLKSSQDCILDDHGIVVKEQTVGCAWSKVVDTLGQQIERPFVICYEAALGDGCRDYTPWLVHLHALSAMPPW